MQGFLRCVWSPRMPYSAAEKGEKKKSACPVGIPSEDELPYKDPVTIPLNLVMTPLVDSKKEQCMMDINLNYADIQAY